jgi:hypothetical protein
MITLWRTKAVIRSGASATGESELPLVTGRLDDTHALVVVLASAAIQKKTPP